MDICPKGKWLLEAPSESLHSTLRKGEVGCSGGRWASLSLPIVLPDLLQPVRAPMSLILAIPWGAPSEETLVEVHRHPEVYGICIEDLVYLGSEILD